jgi:hypothetical protein
MNKSIRLPSAGTIPGGPEKKDGSLAKIGITPSAPANVRLGFNSVMVQNSRVK